MDKSNWKLPYLPLKWLTKKNYFTKKIVLSNYRSAIISKRLVGLRINVYNGAWLLTKTLDERMVGRKIGEFSMTKRFDTQRNGKKKSKKKKSK